MAWRCLENMTHVSRLQEFACSKETNQFTLLSLIFVDGFLNIQIAYNNNLNLDPLT